MISYHGPKISILTRSCDFVSQTQKSPGKRDNIILAHTSTFYQGSGSGESKRRREQDVSWGNTLYARQS